jgi:hypothetical protein
MEKLKTKLEYLKADNRAAANKKFATVLVDLVIEVLSNKFNL